MAVKKRLIVPRKKMKLLVLSAAILIVLAAVIFQFFSTKEERLIEEFVNTWLIDSQENQEILQFYEKSGDSVNDAQSAEKSRQEFAEIIESSYQKYLTDNGQEIFRTELFSAVSYNLYKNYEYHVSSCKIQKDGSVYKVKITLDLSGESSASHEMLLKMQMKDGKIHWIDIIEGAQIQE